VEEGKTANLVLLTANPMDDIRNTQKIHALVVGKLLIRTDLRGCRDESGSGDPLTPLRGQSNRVV
jgi:hypothetical protein